MMKQAENSQTRFRTRVLLLVGWLVLAFPATGALAAESFFKLGGDLDIEVAEADAGPVLIRRKIPAINLTSSPDMIKQLGKSYSVNLFLPDDFGAAPGTYPIAFSYRGQPGTLGASVMASGKILSHDTEGQVEFSDEGEDVRVVFSFRVASASEGAADRQMVTVEGEAVFDRAGLATLQ